MSLDARACAGTVERTAERPREPGASCGRKSAGPRRRAAQATAAWLQGRSSLGRRTGRATPVPGSRTGGDRASSFVDLSDRRERLGQTTLLEAIAACRAIRPPRRQMALLCLLDELLRDGRSQAPIATHSPILMSHPGCDPLWIDGDGIDRRPLADIPPWRDMNRFMRYPGQALSRLLDDEQS